MTVPKDIEAEIYFLTKEEGGRSNAVFSGYRGQFYYNEHDWCAFQIYPDVKSVNPGETVRSYLCFTKPKEHLGKVYVGMEFLIREGNQTVGRGIITKIIELEESANHTL